MSGNGLNRDLGVKAKCSFPHVCIFSCLLRSRMQVLDRKLSCTMQNITRKLETLNWDLETVFR